MDAAAETACAGDDRLYIREGQRAPQSLMAALAALFPASVLRHHRPAVHRQHARCHPHAIAGDSFVSNANQNIARIVHLIVEPQDHGVTQSCSGTGPRYSTGKV